MPARTVMGVLSDIWQAAADNVGKIKIVDDLKTDSAVFDLPADIAKQLLEKRTPEGEVIAPCKSLPKLVESEFGSERGGDMYGRFSRGRGGSIGGGSRRGRDRIRDSDRFGSRERSSRSDRGSFSEHASSATSRVTEQLIVLSDGRLCTIHPFPTGWL